MRSKAAPFTMGLAGSLISIPDSRERVFIAADARRRAYSEYQRTRKKLDDQIAGEQPKDGSQREA